MLKISEDEYYMYCTSAGNGYYCWRSSDMIHWGDKKMCFVKTDDAWSRDCFWAPEVVAKDGRYYMFYTAKNHSGSLRIGLAIADHPAGPFKDFENRPFLDLGYATIDANVLLDDDGRNYLYFSKDCSENVVDGKNTSQIWGIELTADLKGTLGEPVLLATPLQTWEIRSGDWRWNEGPEVIKHNGTYYLTYSANYFESPAYSIGYATSDKPLGVYVKAEENPILTSGKKTDVSGTGHHSFVMSPDGTELWVAYHSHTDVKKPSGDRKVNICLAGFTPDGKLRMNGPYTFPQGLPSGTKVEGSDFKVVNVTDRFKAMSKTKTDRIEALTDGVMSIHPKDILLESRLYLEDRQAVIRFEAADKATTLNEVVIYPGQTGLPAGTLAEISFEDGTSETFWIFGKVKADEPVIISFKGRTGAFDLKFRTAEDTESISVSEVQIFLYIL